MKVFYFRDFIAWEMYLFGKIGHYFQIYAMLDVLVHLF